MGLRNQIQKIFDNWLIVLVVLALFLGMSGVTRVFSTASSIASGKSYDYLDSAGYTNSYGKTSDFAPEIEDRVLVKTTTMTSKIKLGTFEDKETRLKSALDDTGSILLVDNANQRDAGWKTYYSASYTIKVPVHSYDALVSKLESLGEVTYFNDISSDITGTYINYESMLKSEQSRLERLESMLSDNMRLEDKISLTDRIAEQERKIYSLEETIRNTGNRVDYSEIRFNMAEDVPQYYYSTLVEFAQLVQDLVNSFNLMLHIGAYALPWVAAYTLIMFVMRIVSGKRKQE